MNRKCFISQIISTAMVAAGIGAILGSPAEAKTRYYLLEEPAYPSTYEWIETMPMGVKTVEKTVTIEKSVIIEKTTKTIRYTRPRATALKMKHRTVAARRPMHRTHVVAYRPAYAQSFTTTKIVEKPVRVERFVETPVRVEKPMIIEKAVEVERPVLVKKHRHLLEFSLL